MIKIKRLLVSGIIGATICAGLSRLSSSSPIYLALEALLGSVIGMTIEVGLSGLYWIIVVRPLRSTEIFLRHYGIVCAWLASIPIYIWGGHDAQSSSQAWYGTAQPYPFLGVVTSIGISGAAMLILYVIVRPRSFHYSLNRLTIPLIIAIGSLFMIMTVILDPPGFQHAHIVYLLFVIVVFLVALALTARGLKQQMSRKLGTQVRLCPTPAAPDLAIDGNFNCSEPDKVMKGDCYTPDPQGE